MSDSDPGHAPGGAPPHTPSRAGARSSVAVVGAGMAGLTAAYRLSRSHDVTVYVAGPSRAVSDPRFLVLNDRTHPVLRRLLTELGVGVDGGDLVDPAHVLAVGS